ncbi:MAG: hypothetical protein HQ541_19115, partial [Mariniphaga sp.]|nr:hypothetical protein [Mariniphaga sp.]
SRDNKGNFVGRVNQFLNHEGIDSGKVYYLCGNSQMINDATDILEEANVPIKNIRSGVFF